jgi:hypothetical protein
VERRGREGGADAAQDGAEHVRAVAAAASRAPVEGWGGDRERGRGGTQAGDGGGGTEGVEAAERSARLGAMMAATEMESLEYRDRDSGRQNTGTCARLQ